MSHLYLVQQEARPEQKVVFTSVDQRGGIGQLSQYVLLNSGLSVSNPTPEDLEKGFHIANDGDRTVVFIVTVTRKTSTAIALQENFGNALSSLSIDKADKSIWVPLMGTGSGGLSFHQSASIVKDVLEEYVDISLSKIIISMPSGIDHKEQITIERVFNPYFIPEPELPSHIQALVDDFLKAFPLSKLQEMSLEQYSNIKKKDYFTYWLEHETSAVGGVKGGSSFKFGIFRRRSKEKKLGNKTYRYTDDYAWYARYGATKEVAFNTILSHIVKTAKCAAKGQIEEITKIQLDSRLKWKIAFLYQNYQKPQVVSIYKKEALRELSNLSGRDFSIAKAHKKLIRMKPSEKDVWSYSNELWHQWSKNDDIESESTEDEQNIQLDNDVIQITGFANDGLLGKDKLGIEREVESLASIIAYKETQPPLSIGIFGEWGSGKSFYMDLLKNRVDKLSEMARNSGLPQNQYPFYKHIKQINFNAWNYVESDLWASLAHTIYQNLYQKENNSSEYDSHWLRVVKYGEEEAKEKEKEIENLETRSNELDEKLTTLLVKEKKLKEEELHFDERSILRERLTPTVQEQCKKYLEEIGLTTDVRTVQEAVALSKEISSLSNRFNLFYKAIANSSKRSLVFLLGVPLAIFLSLFFITQSTEGGSLLTTLGSFFAIASSSTLWMKSRIAIVSNWLTTFEKIQLEVSSLKDKKLDELKEYKFENIKNLKDTAAKLAEKRKEKKKLLAEIEEAKLNLNELTPESVLAHHIGETLGDNRYGKFLGLPAILSQDFETLSKTIQQQNQLLEDDKLFPSLEVETKAEGAEHRINRIVLYIDDLDRCEPDTVVKVLEAVHLFLASPLFIVVLGVDPRWLFSSIREHYASLMMTESTLNQDIVSTSTPEEYLEKIFQVPIWLEQPSSDSVKALISSIVGTLTNKQVEEGSASSDTSPLPKTQEGSENINDVEINKLPKNSKIDADKASELNKKGENTISTETELLLLAQHHNLEAVEIEFIHGLSPILGRSPRSVKRYLNLYRLIKSSMNEEMYEKFVNSIDDEEEGFKSVAFLLAVVVGQPVMASSIFKCCSMIEKPTSISSLLSKVKEQNLEVKNLHDNLQSFEVSCRKITFLLENLSSLNTWVKVVSRYSYNKLECNS